MVQRRLTPRGAATKARIVGAAAVLIRQRGTAGTNLDDIRHATATSKSQLFHYFPGGRAELLRAVARHEAEQVLADQQPFLGELSDWASWLRWRDALLRRHEAQRGRGPLCSLTVHLAAAAPATVTELTDAWARALAEGVRALQAAGDADPQVKPEEAAKAVISGIQGGVTLLLSTGDSEFLEAALDASLARLKRA
jgi:AcrR family transcriptional regulator